MIRRVNAFLLLALIGFSLWGYARLPAEIPVHFDLDGKVNGVGSRSTFLLLPAIGIASVLILQIAIRFTARNPKLINLPDKKKLLSLPHDEQLWVIEPVASSMDWLNAMLLMLFLVIEYSMYTAALGRDVHRLVNGALFVFIPAMTVFPLYMIISVQKRLDAAVKRADQAPGAVMR